MPSILDALSREVDEKCLAKAFATMVWLNKEVLEIDARSPGPGGEVLKPEGESNDLTIALFNEFTNKRLGEYQKSAACSCSLVACACASSFS
jgi:hypothetical protein